MQKWSWNYWTFSLALPSLFSTKIRTLWKPQKSWLMFLSLKVKKKLVFYYMTPNRQLPKAPVTMFLNLQSSTLKKLLSLTHLFFVQTNDFFLHYVVIYRYISVQILMSYAAFIVSTCLYWMLSLTFYYCISFSPILYSCLCIYYRKKKL